MDYAAAAPAAFGHSLTGLTVNLLCRDVLREGRFLRAVFGMALHQPSRDFAIATYGAWPFQLHSDASFARHPLHALLPEAGARGAGIELRLHDSDPDAACALAAVFDGAMVLAEPRDKAAHGLREAVILSPEGYAWVPSRRL